MGEVLRGPAARWGNWQRYDAASMTHRLNLVLLVLFALVALPYYWLFLDNPSRDVAPQPVRIAQLRTLADNLPGPHPAKVAVIISGWSREPGNFHAAGAGMKRRLLSSLSFRLDVPGSGPVVIDTGVIPQFAASPLQRAMPERQRMIERNLREASLILATQETGDHLSGLAAFARTPDSAQTMARVKLNSYQVPRGAGQDRIGWPDGLVLRPALTGAQPIAAAAGVVVIPAPGPSPGAQMVYVRLQDGREYLFAGEIAPFAVNYQELRVRSHFLCLWRAGQDRAAVMRWLVTIAALRREAPGLIVVPGRDFEWIIDPKNGLRIEHVSASPSSPKPAGI